MSASRLTHFLLFRALGTVVFKASRPRRVSELCDLDCGPHGHCVDNACDCLPGWSGELCNLKQCDPRCNEHGQCKNGTCLCVTGWNGKHCTMEGCPNSCSGHGQCRVSNDAQWECQCYNGWDGKDCSVLLEQNCNDGRDNDKGTAFKHCFVFFFLILI